MNYFSNENTIANNNNIFNNDNEKTQHAANWNDLMLRYQQEEECYAEYDRNMADTVVEADYQDLYYYHQHSEDETMMEDEPMMEDDEEYSYEDDSLLSLIVGVQSYLTEQTTAGTIQGKSDSPLYELQYKMYTYMKQRAYEMGVELQ